MIRPVRDGDYRHIARLWYKISSQPSGTQMQFPMTTKAYRFLAKKRERVFGIVADEGIDSQHICGFISGNRFTEKTVLLGDLIVSPTANPTTFMELLVHAYRQALDQGYDYILSATKSEYVITLSSRLGVIILPEDVSAKFGLAKEYVWLLDPLPGVVRVTERFLTKRSFFNWPRELRWPNISISDRHRSRHVVQPIAENVFRDDSRLLSGAPTHKHVSVGVKAGTVHIKHGERQFELTPEQTVLPQGVNSMTVSNFRGFIRLSNDRIFAQWRDDHIRSVTRKIEGSISLISSDCVAEVSWDGAAAYSGNVITFEQPSTVKLHISPQPQLTTSGMDFQSLSDARVEPKENREWIHLKSKEIWLLHRNLRRFVRIRQRVRCGEWCGITCIVYKSDNEWHCMRSLNGQFTVIAQGYHGISIEMDCVRRAQILSSSISAEAAHELIYSLSPV